MKLGDVTSGEGKGALLPLLGSWVAHPETGMLALNETALAQLINPDPIERWYVLDPEPIARGQFAVVYHCRHRITGEEYVAKFSSRWRLGGDCTADIIHEIAVCAALRPTPRTVQLQDVFSTETHMVLVLEYAPGGDLQTLLDEDMVPYERDVKSFMRQLLEGLVFIHDNDIVHLDIKPQNLVLMGDFPHCAVKLCDFEISRFLTPGHEVREILGTPDYVAPEILQYEPITLGTDMWSVGVLTYVLLTGFLPFGGDTDQETFMQISRGELDFPAELFDDISPEAIEFIKKLLIREPKKRMSARDCLNHPWMTKECLPVPQTPTILPAYTPTSTTTQPFVPPVSTAQPFVPPVSTAQPFVPPASTPQPFVPPVSTPSSVVPPPSTPDTPTRPMPPRDIGLPPMHPHSPVKTTESFITSPTSPLPPVPPSSFQRQESKASTKANLDRFRSLSKSREVLSERIQMSNLKKTMSKSRERLCEARLGLSKSRERLWGLRSISQSVEALSALSKLHQEGAIYNSCNSLFLPVVKKAEKESNTTCRMYKSLAAIDQLDQIGDSESGDCHGYFESRFSIDDDDYNDLITRHNTTMNSNIGNTDEAGVPSKRTESRLRSSPRGGRAADPCDKRCPRNHKHPEPRLTQKIPKISRVDRMKRDAQRRRKERKEKERLERENQRKNQPNEVKPQEKTQVSEPSHASTSRRGSVSHVEQRLQERHERLQERLERLEKQEKEERRASISSTSGRRRGSVELDRTTLHERMKANRSSLGVQQERPRSATPTRRNKIKKEPTGGSDVSQASSLESVEVAKERPVRPTTLALPEIHISPTVKPSNETSTVDTSDDRAKEEPRGDVDEAYISLDEPSRDGTFSRSRSIDSSAPSESNTTLLDTRQNDQNTASDTLDSNADNQTSTNKDSSATSKTDNQEDVHDTEMTLNLRNTSERGLGGSTDLTIIQENKTLTINTQLLGTEYTRSVSMSSDIGSMVSESSETSVVSDKDDNSHTLEVEPGLEWKTRARSMSIQAGGQTSNKCLGRSRSNSVHLDTPVNARAMPWGGVCTGSIARALEKFNINKNEMTPVGRSIHKRRQSSPLISPATEGSHSFDY